MQPLVFLFLPIEGWFLSGWSATCMKAASGFCSMFRTSELSPVRACLSLYLSVQESMIMNTKLPKVAKDSICIDIWYDMIWFYNIIYIVLQISKSHQILCFIHEFHLSFQWKIWSFSPLRRYVFARLVPLMRCWPLCSGRSGKTHTRVPKSLCMIYSYWIYGTWFLCMLVKVVIPCNSEMIRLQGSEHHGSVEHQQQPQWFDFPLNSIQGIQGIRYVEIRMDILMHVKLFPIQGQELTLALFLYSGTATVVLILASHKLVRINYNQLRQELKTCLKIETHSIWTVQG